MKIVDERDPQTYAIIGAAVIEFPLKQIPFEREVSLPIQYKNIVLPTHYRADDEPAI